MKIKFGSLLVFALFGFIGCNNSTKTSSDEAKQDTLLKPKALDTSLLRKIDKEKEAKYLTIIANIPAPSFEAVEISKAGLRYNIDFCNLPANQDKYTTSYKRAINYGIYLSDLSYVVSYGKVTSIMQYYEAAKKAAKATAVINIFEKIITEEHFKEHIEETIVLEDMIDKVFTASDEFLISDHHLDIATKIIIGTWVENQFLVLMNLDGIERSEKNDKLFKKVWEQKIHLGNINSLLEEYGRYKEMAFLTEKLKAFYENYYAKLSSDKELNKKSITAMSRDISEIRKELVALD